MLKTPRTLAAALLALTLACPSLAASKDLGNGFVDHGVCSPISNHRGTVATTSADGHNLLLLWLMDHRGGYALLCCDATTGKVTEHAVPFKFTEFDAPYASILSSKNKFYTHQNNHFIEFDPDQRKFTACHKSAPQMAMSMTEDDAGRIWSATYPDGGLVSYDPASQTFTDYGYVHHENWKQYNRHMAADDAGFIYFAVGNTASQIVIFDPSTRKSTAVLPASERKQGAVAYVYRDYHSGKVYGQPVRGDDEPWYELYKGVARKLDSHKVVPHPRRVITGSQTLNETTFRDGTRATCDLVNRVFTVNPATGPKKEYPFDYSSDGAIVMAASASPDNTIVGGTAFPMRFYRYDPKADTLADRPAYGQWNTAQRQGDHFIVFGYPSGFLLDYDPAKPWVPTTKTDANANPRFLVQVSPDIHRPHEILTLADGRTVVGAGTPDYGFTGGGLLIYDRSDNSHTLLKDADLVPDQSAHALADLGNNLLLAGTTTTPGTGGEKKAREALLYTFDVATRKITWKSPLIPGAQEYTDLAPAPSHLAAPLAGRVPPTTQATPLIYGIADSHTFFVFNPATRTITHQFDLTPKFGITAHEQGPRLFIPTPDGRMFLLLKKGIAQIDPKTHALTLLAQSPHPINGGGDHLNGRLYFICGSHLLSYPLPTPTP